MIKLRFVKVVKENNSLRVIQCDATGKRIGSYFVTFPKDLRVKGRIYLVKDMRIAYCKKDQQNYWVALKRKNIIKVV